MSLLFRRSLQEHNCFLINSSISRILLWITIIFQGECKYSLRRNHLIELELGSRTSLNHWLRGRNNYTPEISGTSVADYTTEQNVLLQRACKFIQSTSIRDSVLWEADARVELGAQKAYWGGTCVKVKGQEDWTGGPQTML